MADDNEKSETPATKEKRTVPAMVRSARGVADHAAAVLEMQWDKEKKAFKDPITSSLALFAYAKLTAALLDEAEKRFDARETAAEIRIEKLEAQIAAFESWRDDVMKQSEEMSRGFEEMMGGIKSPEDALRIVSDRLGFEAGTKAATKAVADTSTVDVGEGTGTTVVPLKTNKKPDDKKSAEKNGGAA